MTITLDYTDLQFDDDRAVLLAEVTDFQFDLLYALVVFRVFGQTNSYESVVGETLSFPRSGDQVAISANCTEATATVGLAELKEAVVGFHELLENPDAQE